MSDSPVCGLVLSRTPDASPKSTKAPVLGGRLASSLDGKNDSRPVAGERHLEGFAFSARISLPMTITWPDGSQTDHVDVLIDEMTDELNPDALAPTARGEQAVADSPGR